MKDKAKEEQDHLYYEYLLGRDTDLAAMTLPRWSSYIPHEPSPKQLAFLMLDRYREVFFGGAAGGGKSDALLMAALQYVDVPNYSAILFRKTLTDLQLSGALIERAHIWLDDTDAQWNGSLHKWSFPSGATLQFGYMASELDRFRYQSAEFQFVGWDELTQFPWDEEYLFMFSRLRRSRCPKHWKEKKFYEKCKTCKESAMLSQVPLRVRSASNPGGVGHQWVKARFKIEPTTDNRTGKVVFRGTDPQRPYVPSYASDNYAIDAEEYISSLTELDPVTREQYARGDWSVSAEGRFKPHWFRRYSLNGEYIVLAKKGDKNNPKIVHRNQCMCFCTCDPAASQREGPGDAQVWRRAPSWTVISTWLVTPDWHLIWWDISRFKKEIPDIQHELRNVYNKHRPEFIGIEANGLGIGVFQMAQRSGLPIKHLSARSLDKLVRSTDLANRAEQGKVWLPENEYHAPWLKDLEGELFTWTGHPLMPADQIDTGSYAAMQVSQMSAFSETTTCKLDMPSVF